MVAVKVVVVDSVTLRVAVTGAGMTVWVAVVDSVMVVDAVTVVG